MELICRYAQTSTLVLIFVCIAVLISGFGFRVWHGALTEDLHAVLADIRRIFGRSLPDVFLCGFSTGTNIISTYMLNPSVDISITAVFGCCINWDYPSSRARLDNAGIHGAVYSRLIAEQFKVIWWAETSDRINVYSFLFLTGLYQTQHSSIRRKRSFTR